MEVLAVFALLAAVILGGALVAYGVAYLPRTIMAGLFSEGIPRWIVITTSYILSLVALKIFGSLFSSWLFLLTFCFAMATLYHLVWPIQEHGTGARLAVIPISLIALTICAMGLRGIGSLYPSMGIGLFFT